MRAHGRRGEMAAGLAAFVNALREFRGQAPLYEDRGGRFSHARRRPTVEEQDAARFYVPPYSQGGGRVMPRGSGC